MFRPLLACLVFASLTALAACGDAPDPGASATSEPTAEATPSAPPGADAARPGADLDQFLASRPDDGPFLESLNPPRTVRTEPEENRHVPGQIDTVRTDVYDGLTIEAYAVTGGRTFIRRVEVTSDAYETSEGLSVGDTRGEVEAVLGAPVRNEGETVVYETGDEPTPTTVEVRYDQGTGGVQRAAAITWSPYLD